MALCEICNKSGYTPNQMFIDQAQQKFVGPCCATNGHVQVAKPQLPPNVKLLTPVQQGAADLEYGVEVSNKVGVRAFANYQGLSVSFEKSPEELKTWAESQGLMTSGT